MCLKTKSDTDPRRLYIPRTNLVGAWEDAIVIKINENENVAWFGMNSVHFRICFAYVHRGYMQTLHFD